MKRVYLIRHSKSSWSDPSLSDFERPLNNRGNNDAPMMAEKMREKVGSVDLILSSTAVRAKETLNQFIQEDGIEYKELMYDDRLYHAPKDRILRKISDVDEKYESVAIVGHNPGLTDLANSFSNVTIDNLPTTGIFAVEFEIEKWKNILNHSGSLLFFDYPKRYKTAKKR